MPYHEKILNASFTDIAEECPAGIFIADPGGKCLYTNQAWRKMTGLSTDKAKGFCWLDIIHPEDREQVSAGWEKFRWQEEAWKSEFRITDKSGNIKWISSIIKLLKNSGNQKAGYMGIFSDINDLKTYRSEHDKIRIIYEHLIENSLDAILLTSPDGKILSANPAACRMFGRTEKELCRLGRNHVIDLKDPRLADALKKRETTGKFSGELILLRKSGKKFPAEISSAVFRGENGDLFSSMIIRDISIQKRKITKLQRLQKKLESINWQLHEAIENERNQIALDLHDDLGQRFTSLKLDLAWLKKRIGVQSQPVNARFDEMYSLINESIEKIRDFITILKPSVLFELGVIPALTWHISQFEKKSGIKCIFRCDPPEFITNETISLNIYRVLQEALTNILKHSEAEMVMIDIRILKNKLEMSIKDNGKGIDMKKINRIYSRGISGMKERVKGSGGKISIKGIPGEGTTIKVIFPMK